MSKSSASVKKGYEMLDKFNWKVTFTLCKLF